MTEIYSGAEFILPAIEEILPSRCHPYAAQAEELDAKWVQAWVPFKDSREEESFLARRCTYWVSWAYPYLAAERFLAMCNFSSLVFALDDVLSLSDAYTEENRGRICQEFIDAMSGSSRKIDEPPSWASGTHDSWQRITRKLSPQQRHRAVQAFSDHLTTSAIENTARSSWSTLDITAYVKIRRQTLAAPLYHVLTEYATEVDLTEDYRVHKSAMANLHTLAADHWLYANDIFSFRKEYFSGDGMNSIQLLLGQGASLQQAIDQIVSLLESTQRQFAKEVQSLKSFFGNRLDMLTYLDALVLAVSGNLSWSRRTPRYHGSGYLTHPIRSGTIALYPDRTVYSPLEGPGR